MVNGFMGDSLMRGSKDTFMGRYETEWDDDLVDILQRKHMQVNLKLLREDIATRIKMRSRVPMEVAIKKGSKYRKIFAWADFYYRQRHYISNNFLQHIGITEALLPFYSWKLLAYKMEHEYKIFSREIYHKIFQNYFPELAKIPHASDLYVKKNNYFGGAQCTKSWAKEILPIIYNKNFLSLLQKRVCVLHSVAGIAGIRKAESSIIFFKRLYLLEKSLRESRLEFDWDNI